MIFSLFFVAKRDKRHTGFTAKSDISMTDLDKEKTNKVEKKFLKKQQNMKFQPPIFNNTKFLLLLNNSLH